MVGIISRVILCCLLVLTLSGVSSAQENHIEIAVISDLHYGNAEGNGYTDNINALLNWLNNTEPDYIFILGDITDDSDPPKWDMFFNDFENLVNTTNISKVFYVLGGSHDGFEDKGTDVSSDDGSQDYGWNGFEQFRRLSENVRGAPCYTVEIGNNAFIFINHMDIPVSGQYDQVIPQIYIDWLERKLQYYSNNSYNTFVLMHPPLNNTNQLTYSAWGMRDTTWQTASSKLKKLFDKYNVDVFFSGHVHSDPSDVITDTGTHSGKVVFGSNFSDLPDTTFVQTGVVCYEHGTYGDYPSAYIMRIYENQPYAELTAYNIFENTTVGISYDDSPTTVSIINIPLKHPVSLQGFNYSFDWIPYRLPDEGKDVKWFDISKGIIANTDTWYEFVWHWSEPKNVISLQVNYTNQNGSISASYYVSEDGVNWQETTLPTTSTKWIKVYLSVNVSNPPLYISWVYPEISSILKDFSPKATNILIKAYTNKTFYASFSGNYSYNWYLNDVLIDSGFGNETVITIQFNETGIYELKLFVDDNLVKSWIIEVYKVIPKIVVSFTRTVTVGKHPIISINITNLDELNDYYIYVDFDGDKVFEIATKNFSIDLPEFTRPALYNVFIKVLDPITGGYNTTTISIQVVDKKLYLGRNIINVIGQTTYAETNRTAHVRVKPIKVSKEFLAIVNHEDILASEHLEEILNISFVGLAGGDKLWINETVLNADVVDIYHNGELLNTIPVKNNSINVTVSTFSTYVFVVNTSSQATQPITEKEEENLFVLLLVTVVFLAISSALLIAIRKNSAIAKTATNYRFFKKLR